MFAIGRIMKYNQRLTNICTYMCANTCKIYECKYVGESLIKVIFYFTCIYLACVFLTCFFSRLCLFSPVSILAQVCSCLCLFLPVSVLACVCLRLCMSSSVSALVYVCFAYVHSHLCLPSSVAASPVSVWAILFKYNINLSILRPCSLLHII